MNSMLVVNEAELQKQSVRFFMTQQAFMTKNEYTISVGHVMLGVHMQSFNIHSNRSQ